MKLLLILLLLGGVALNTSCASRQNEPEPGPSMQQPQDQNWEITLSGYRSADERKAFVQRLESLGLELKQLNAGAGQAVWQATTVPTTLGDWLRVLSEQTAAEYRMERNEQHLLFIRLP